MAFIDGRGHRRVGRTFFPGPDSTEPHSSMCIQGSSLEVPKRSPVWLCRAPPSCWDVSARLTRSRAQHSCRDVSVRLTRSRAQHSCRDGTPSLHGRDWSHTCKKKIIIIIIIYIYTYMNYFLRNVRRWGFPCHSDRERKKRTSIHYTSLARRRSLEQSKNTRPRGSEVDCSTDRLTSRSPAILPADQRKGVFADAMGAHPMQTEAARGPWPKSSTCLRRPSSSSPPS